MKKGNAMVSGVDFFFKGKSKHKKAVQRAFKKLMPDKGGWKEAESTKEGFRITTFFKEFEATPLDIVRNLRGNRKTGEKISKGFKKEGIDIEYTGSEFYLGMDDKDAFYNEMNKIGKSLKDIELEEK